MKKVFMLFTITIFLGSILSSCGGGGQNAVADAPVSDADQQDQGMVEEPAPLPTATEVPTAAPTEVPTETPTLEPTEAPPWPFRDDFDQALDESWEWINEEADRWEITEEGFLQITAGNPAIAQETPEIPMINLLTKTIPEGVDIAVTTHLVDTNPDENFEQATLFLIEDGDSFVLVNLGFCSFCTQKSIYLEGAVDGTPLLEGVQSVPIPEDVTEVWLRLEYSPEAGAVVALFALEDGDWQRVGPVIQNAPAITMIGIGASNIPGPESNPEEDLIASFDYVEIEVFE